jgi:hypothetical protein
MALWKSRGVEGGLGMCPLSVVARSGRSLGSIGGSFRDSGEGGG